MGFHSPPSESQRVLSALRAVLPPAAVVTVVSSLKGETELALAGRTVRACWVGEGRLGVLKAVLESPRRPEVVVGRHFTPGGKDALAQAGVSWVDETGAAEIALESIIVSRTGRTLAPEPTPPRWTPAVVAVAEALLCGVGATVLATSTATGLSTGSCTAALRTLVELELLSARQARGRGSSREVVDPGRLLEAYVPAATALAPALYLTVGITWRDPVAGLRELGRRWTSANVSWAATGAVAAELLAPLLTSTGTVEAYVKARTIAELDGLARTSGLRPMEGGRLTLRPFPTAASETLATLHDGVAIAPWPRVYVDLIHRGVRGEEAAEHLREVTHVRRTRTDESGSTRG